MRLEDIARLRLVAQGLASAERQSLPETAEQLVAIQAQDPASAGWTVGLRTGCTEGDIRKALGERRLVRSWSLRATIHLMVREDVYGLIDLAAPRIRAAHQREYLRHGLMEEVIQRSQAVLQERFHRQPTLTRKDVVALWKQAGLPTEGVRSNLLVYRAGMDGALGMAGVQGKDPVYVWMPEYLPRKEEPLPREEALAKLALRYVQGYGPVTAADFAWWAGCTLTEARAAVEALSGELASFAIEKQTYWMPKGMGEALEPEEGRVHLLAPFDPLLMGYADRMAMVDKEGWQRICGNGNGILSPTLAVDGQVAGTWKRTIGKKDVTVEVTPWGPLPKKLRQKVEAEAERYARYLGLQLRLILP